MTATDWLQKNKATKRVSGDGVLTTYRYGSFTIEQIAKMMEDYYQERVALGLPIIKCDICKDKGEYLCTHPEKYGMVTCECKK
jgi:hypothetical protein